MVRTEIQGRSHAKENHGQLAPPGKSRFREIEKIAELIERTKQEPSLLMEDVPQVLQNVVVPPNRNPLSNPEVKRAIADTEQALAGSGRLLVRKSGTEPTVRVMLEGDNQERIEVMAAELCQIIQRVAGMVKDE